VTCLFICLFIYVGTKELINNTRVMNTHREIRFTSECLAFSGRKLIPIPMKVLHLVQKLFHLDDRRHTHKLARSNLKHIYYCSVLSVWHSLRHMLPRFSCSYNSPIAEIITSQISFNRPKAVVRCNFTLHSFKCSICRKNFPLEALDSSRLYFISSTISV
jgi:hypothetical protein